MKHLFLPALLCSLGAAAQIPYDFEVLNQPYAPLENAPALEFDSYDYLNGWDDPEFTVELGFNLDIDGITTNSLDQVGTGTILFSNSAPSAGLIPISYDLADLGFLNPKTPSLIRWETTGVSGEQVFAMEFSNCGFYEEVFSGDSSFSSVNVQMRVFEGSGVIEFHYGPSSISPSITEPTWAGIGLNFDPFTYDGSFLVPTGNAQSPDLTLITNIYDFYYTELLSGFPDEGTVYRFTPNGNTLGVDEFGAPGLSAWPNPSSGVTTVEFEGMFGWTLTDAVGRAVMSGSARDGVRLDMGPLDGGTYLFRLDDGRVKRLVRH